MACTRVLLCLNQATSHSEKVYNYLILHIHLQFRLKSTLTAVITYIAQILQCSMRAFSRMFFKEEGVRKARILEKKKLFVSETLSSFKAIV